LAGKQPEKLKVDDPSFEPNHCGLRSIICAQFGKNALDSTLDGFLRDAELVRDLFVRITGCDQPQYADLCRRQCVIHRMRGDFIGDLWRKGLLPGIYPTDGFQEFLV
jgi:hypothetical protein